MCQVTKNTQWKRNRNLYAIWLLDMVLNKKLEKPFTKVPPDGNNLNMLQATEVKAKLSQKVKNIMNKRDKSEERRMKMGFINAGQNQRTNMVNLNAETVKTDNVIHEINVKQS